MKISKDFVDISLAFEVNPRSGDITTIKNERAIQNSIKNIVMTKPKELMFSPNFGSYVSNYLFDFIDVHTSNEIKNEIIRSIKFNEPRVNLTDVIVNPEPDNNRFLVKIIYKIIGYDEEVQINEILTPTN